jgi:polar amino acid transport system permease protein
LDFKKEQGPISPTPLKPEATILNAVPIRHYGRWVATVFLLLVAAVMVKSLLTNPRFRWGVVGEYIVSTPILEGLRLTLILTVVAQLLGIVIGIILAIMRLSSNRVLARAAWIYIWFFRGTPLLVQLIFWYNISALYPEIAFGIPFGPTFWQGNANELITPFAVAILGLALNEGAYMAEIVRGGIAGIDRGQSESAKALGMTHMQTLRRIILPQAVKVIIPPTGNQTILMLKTTSLVSVLALADLLYTAQTIYARTFETMPLLLVASLWYLVITSVLTFGQYFLERHFTEGAPERMSFTERFTGISSMRRKSTKQIQSGEAEHND